MAEEGHDIGVDIVARTPDKQRVVAEAKLYRSPRIPASLIENAVRQLLMMKKELQASRALLMTTMPALPSIILKPLLEAQLEVWDLRQLTRMASVSRELLAELSSLLRDAEIGSVGGGAPPPEVADAIAAGTLGLPEQEGQALISQLSTIKCGRKHWRRFEEWSFRAVNYLFGDQFGLVTAQHGMEGGFRRMDFIARIVPTHAFWESLTKDFHTRYVVFEFKNYCGSVSQDQVFMTEKYLYRAALRSIAVIVSRREPSKSALRAVKAVLRESGKLVLLVSISDIREMLAAKDRGDDPNNRMVETLDGVLTDIVP